MRGEGRWMRKITAHWRRLGEKFAVILLVASMRNCVLLVSNQSAAAFFGRWSMGLL